MEAFETRLRDDVIEEVQKDRVAAGPGHLQLGRASVQRSSLPNDGGSPGSSLLCVLPRVLQTRHVRQIWFLISHLA